MGNKEKTDNFNKVSSTKVVRQIFSTKNSQHVNTFSYCDAAKDNLYSNSGKKAVQNEIKTEKSFAERENTRNIKKGSFKEMTWYPSKDSSGWKTAQGKRNKKERHIRTYENKIFAQNMNKERFKFSERRTVQSNFQQPILNENLDQKSAFRKSKCINSNLIENKMDSGLKNSKSYSSVISENLQQNYKKYDEKLDASIAKLSLKENLDKQSEELVLSTEVPAKHSLESETNCFLKNKGAITKTSRYTQTSIQAEATSGFVTNIKEQNIHKTEKSELKKNEILQSDPIIVKKEMTSNKKGSKILKDSIRQTCVHGYFKETITNINKCNKIGQISKEVKANRTNKEKVNEKVTDACDNQYADRSQLKDETIENNLEHELHYPSYNNYLLCRPITIYPLHPCVPNSGFEQNFNTYADFDMLYQHFYTGGLCNESHLSEFPNVTNEQYNILQGNKQDLERGTHSFHPYVPDSAFEQDFSKYSVSGIPYQHSYNELLHESNHIEFPNVTNYYLDQHNKQSLESERNDCSNPNGFIYQSSNLNYAYCIPFVQSWYENGMIYYQYYPDFSPVQCPFFETTTQRS